MLSVYYGIYDYNVRWINNCYSFGMATQVPHRKPFDLINKLSKGKTVVFYLMILLAIIPFTADKVDGIVLNENLKQAILYFNLVFMISYSVVTWVLEFHLIPNAEENRRSDMFDNSFGTTFNIESSEGYFTNEEMSDGVKKFAVNLFQNSFWSSEISNKMFLPSLIKSLIFSLVMFTAAFWGFNNVPFIIPLFQVYLSAYVVSGTIKLYKYNFQVNQVLKELKEFFASETSSKSRKGLAKTIRLYVSYECNISWSMVQLNSKHFSSMNDELEDKWTKIKVKYNINGVK